MPTSRGPCSVSALPLLLGFLLLRGGAPSHAADTVAVGRRPLSGEQRLVSKRGKFALGFFQPDTSSQNWYIGIWYNQIPKYATVWVANRDAPVSDPASAQLSVSSHGNMVLHDGHAKSPVWSTNASIASGSGSGSTVIGLLLDTGNLVLADASNTSLLLWQSFDHLGDTWLPGGKLGRNKRTGEVTRLFAWKGYDDPAPGAFSLELDPDGANSQYLLSWNGTAPYWTSGNWTGHGFTAVPEMMATGSYPRSLYTFGYVEGVDESYFVYDVTNDAVVTRLVVDVTGRVQFLMWLESAADWMLIWSEPKAQCDVYALCGAFAACVENALPSCRSLRGFSERRPHAWLQGDHAAGCVRNTALQQCTRGRGVAVQGATATQKTKDADRFYTMVNVKLPSNAQGLAPAASSRDCELACLGNCACTGYAYNGSCSLWHGGLINLQDTSSTGTGGGTIMIRLAASEFTSTGHNKKLMIIGVVAAAVTVIVLAASVLVLRSTRAKAPRRVKLEGPLMAFTYRDMQSVTKNFSEKLGGGAFGSVFKGSLPDDATATLVAVKKLEGVRQGEKQFRAEVSTIGTIQHVNLIRLLGFCSEGSRRMLVYEHMPNASLDRHLFGSGSSHMHGVVLSWETRYRIALGVARGLHYLHQKCRDCIIHCDIKPENILLDDTFAAKVADFGLSKLVDHGFSRVLTTVRGTVGYLAPEWIAGTAITTKADVYSYGMMLFEIMSGRRNLRQRQDSMLDFFPLQAAMKLTEGGELEGLVDTRLQGCNVESAEVERVCMVACWCIQDDEPAMATVVQVLEGLVEVNVPPVPRSLKLLTDQLVPSEFTLE